MKRILLFLMFLLVVFPNFSSVHANPYLASSTDKSHWDDLRGSNSYTMTSGRRLAYDIYADKYTSDGYGIVTDNFGKGDQKYLKFFGWAVIFGRQTHTATNHETFIIVRKYKGDDNLGMTKVYTTKNGNLDATEDLEYNNQGAGVWNECSSSALNKDNLSCNMRYVDVNFSAYVPLKDLFPDPTEDAAWNVYIAKRVGSWYVYSPLKTPFSFADRKYNGGEISFNSGVQDGGYLSTDDYPVIRRTYPRQTAKDAPSKYFTTDKPYKMIDKDESDTAIWYGLRSPEDGNAKRWANSVYFGVTGDNATIRFDAPPPPPDIPDKPEEPDGTCKAPVLPKDRYKYELDLVAQTIDAKVTEANKSTTTKVTYRRYNYAANRQKAKDAIQTDIDKRKSLRTSQQTKLKSEKADYAQQEKEYDAADKAGDEDRAKAVVARMKVTLQNIANLECSIDTLTVEINHYEKEKDTIEAKEVATQSVTTPTQLRFGDDTVLSTKSVTLEESDIKTISYTWTLKEDGDVSGIINPEGATFSGITEKSMKNNTITTEILTASKETAAMCAPLGQTSQLDGLVRTVNDRTSGVKSYSESITTQILMSTKDLTRKAGYGFNYEIESVYENQDPESTATGTKIVRSYFPVLSNYLPYVKNSRTYGKIDLSGYEIGLIPSSTTLWTLPNSYLEVYSGNVFDSMTSTHSKRNPEDTLVSGGTKFYIPFSYPNQTLTFDSIALDAGVNRMNTCVTAGVEVTGSALNDPEGNDDFYTRALSPGKPFPSGIGWNFNNSSVLSDINGDLKKWYSSNPYNNTTNKSPVIHSYKLTPNTIKQIQEYNATRPLYTPGKSIFDSINIPRK